MSLGKIHEGFDFELPELECYRTLSRSGVHYQQGLFVAEGEKVVPRLLASERVVVSLLVSSEWFDRLRGAIEARPEFIDVYLLDKAGVEKLTGRTCYQPIKAVAKVPPAKQINDLPLDEGQPVLLAAIDGLSNADNVGALVRNSVGLGATGLVVGETSSSPYLRRAVHASMGSVFSVPVVEALSLESALSELRRRDVFCLAAHPAQSGTRLSELALPPKVCVVFGSEGYGIRDSVLQQCDGAAGVPMSHGVDSLNVASSSAVFFYELQRQLGRV